MLLLAAGAGYRVLLGEQQRFASPRAVISHMLSSLPLEFGTWRSRPAPLGRPVEAAIKAEAYLSRLCEDLSTGEEVFLFVTAARSARAMLGHRPKICYPAIGWILEDTRVIDIAADAGPLQVRVQTFANPEAGARRQLVLSYFIVSGKVTIDEGDFRGLYWRRAFLGGQTSSPLLQVQVIAPATSSPASTEQPAVRFAVSSIPLLLSLVQGPPDLT
jgi:EpsI family protein